MRRQLMLYAQGYFLHPHWIEVGVEVLERWFEPDAGPCFAAGARRRATGAIEKVRPVVGVEVERVDTEVQASERQLWHRQLEDVVEHAPAAVHFPAAVTGDVPRRPHPRRQFVAERKVDRVYPGLLDRAIERHGLVFLYAIPG